MPATVVVNFRTVVHQKSGGVAMAFPDVCKTPSPGGPIPIPYPNIARSTHTAQGTKKVQADGCQVMVQGSNFSQSTGDEAGSAGGVVSNCIKGKAEFILYSFDVQFEGKPVARLGDLMVQNMQSAPNTPPFPEIQPPNLVIDIPALDEPEEDIDLVSLEHKEEEEGD